MWAPTLSELTKTVAPPLELSVAVCAGLLSMVKITVPDGSPSPGNCALTITATESLASGFNVVNVEALLTVCVNVPADPMKLASEL